jgi:hypothetical protein
VTQDTYAKPRSGGGEALKPTPFGGVQAAEQQQQPQHQTPACPSTKMKHTVS